MKLEFDEATHTYRIDGEVAMSITEVCRFLNYDIRSDRPWLAREAADRGTRVHAATAATDWGVEPEEDPEIEGYLTAYARFLADYTPKWEGIEIALADADLGVAGTIDRFGVIGGRDCVLDIKTGARTQKPYVRAQLNGYDLLLDKNLRVSTRKLYELDLANDGTYKLVEHHYDYELFKAAYTLACAVRKGKKK